MQNLQRSVDSLTWCAFSCHLPLLLPPWALSCHVAPHLLLAPGLSHLLLHCAAATAGMLGDRQGCYKHLSSPGPCPAHSCCCTHWHESYKQTQRLLAAVPLAHTTCALHQGQSLLAMPFGGNQRWESGAAVGYYIWKRGRWKVVLFRHLHVLEGGGGREGFSMKFWLD